MQVDYTVIIWKEGSQFIAQALPLDVTSAGDDPQDARSKVDEAVRLFLATAAEMGTLGQVLEECGYVAGEDGWRAPEWVSVERHSTQLIA